MRVDVLGTDYAIRYSNERDTPALIGSDGYCDHTVKEIVLDRMQCDAHDSLGDMEWQRTHVLRHELVHAFLFESGLHEYSRDETIVDWIAAMIPRINAAVDAAQAKAKTSSGIVAYEHT